MFIEQCSCPVRDHNPNKWKFGYSNVDLDRTDYVHDSRHRLITGTKTYNLVVQLDSNGNDPG